MSYDQGQPVYDTVDYAEPGYDYMDMQDDYDIVDPNIGVIDVIDNRGYGGGGGVYNNEYMPPMIESQYMSVQDHHNSSNNVII